MKNQWRNRGPDMEIAAGSCFGDGERDEGICGCVIRVTAETDGGIRAQVGRSRGSSFHRGSMDIRQQDEKKSISPQRRKRHDPNE